MAVVGLRGDEIDRFLWESIRAHSPIFQEGKAAALVAPVDEIATPPLLCRASND
ncbi:MAG: hypothetical protein HS120_01070 [Burkholderiales bacterium]|nr:hypothetical protein [Burkholderiales bacterium]